MSATVWSLTTDLHEFELNESGAICSEWHGREALYMENRLGHPVLLKNGPSCDRFRLKAEIACPSAPGFIGLVFGARDSRNYELIYVSPASDDYPGEIQYDPIMNGSSTWQIYNGPKYQAPAPFQAGKWTKLCLDVGPREVSVKVGDVAEPQLVISKLQLGRCEGTIGVWSYLPGYIRYLSLEPLDSDGGEDGDGGESGDERLRCLAAETFITEWNVSAPYAAGSESAADKGMPTRASVEENGTLNLNRLFASAQGMAVEASCTFAIAEERVTVLTCGFSDRLRLWVNGEEIYGGEWKWAPPGSDGRIRSDFAEARIRWQAGLNTIQAEIVSTEVIFGWGLAVKTGLVDMKLVAGAQDSVR
ncbi:hypothetical protein [Paenibacillus ginsengarvi]|uniref:DUF1080 domain-containing protein n=1 Tax=Paenibacillus ginsengarvi TaxID=400777 RepID=A0A3B0BI60_9BACL|nr:hypothetical protein [Paenibacillus ginsengarvi]RKN71908.1 hypothetical protein D7M11_29205 [Paenibacillus ginsengarvi]